MNDRSPAAFGTRLREARERQGVTLRHIANKTKISIGALEALERNDISKLPGGIFSRAFVRSYAIDVGLDPEETIREFVAQFPNDSVTVGHLKSRPIEDYEAAASDRRVAATALRLVAISLPIALALLYFLANP
jgi:cytoskeletal protein RodZ